MNFSPHEFPPEAQNILIRGAQEKLAAVTLTDLNAVFELTQNLAFSDRKLEITDGTIHLKGKYHDPDSAAAVEKAARQLIPWRKGPFRLADLTVDGEWRSDKKWDRLLPALPDLKGKTVADVGCNNGYYLFRIAGAGARRVVGFDPTLKYWVQFQLAAAHAPELPIGFLPLGWEALEHLPEYFDVIFLMGINYHDSQPLNIFHLCRSALKPAGLLVCESVVVPGDADLEIFPPGKYAGIGGVYAIPTDAALKRQLEFAGFSRVEEQHNVPLIPDEQRPSEFSPQKSLGDFLTQEGKLSIEGYPAPYRAALFAWK
jgi:tRNA (mo5U34)-methyltransferase